MFLKNKYYIHVYIVRYICQNNIQPKCGKLFLIQSPDPTEDIKESHTKK